jgi:hypothetical protein
MDRNLFLSYFAVHVRSNRRLFVPVIEVWVVTFRTHAVMFTERTVRFAHSTVRRAGTQRRTVPAALGVFLPRCTGDTVQIPTKLQCLGALYKVHRTFSGTRYVLC